MKTAYLIGIGGAGLSGLARYLHHNGYLIFGADTSESEIAQKLRDEIDATIYSEHAPENVPDHCDLVVYSPAVPKSNPERVVATEKEISQYTYPEYLGVISSEKKTIAIAGTNGKTTTTTMVATVLDELKLDPTVIVGGQMPRFGSNFRAGNSDLFVVEACEYKNSFLSLHPDIVVVTNITPDHLDYFGTVENYLDTFKKFIGRIPKDGVLVIDPNTEYTAQLVVSAEERGILVVDYTQFTKQEWNLSVPGQYNVYNAAAALSAYMQLGTEKTLAQEVIETKFETADRRFQLLGMTSDGAVVYDDYAHNTDALEVLISGVRERYSDKKIVMIFQPHMYSRTQEFYEEFVSQLSRVDHVYLLPIYGAREKQEDFKVTSNSLVDSIGKKAAMCESITVAVDLVEQANFGNDYIVITAGAGEADKVGKELVK